MIVLITGASAGFEMMPTCQACGGYAIVRNMA